MAPEMFGVLTRELRRCGAAGESSRFGIGFSVQGLGSQGGRVILRPKLPKPKSSDEF